MKKTPIHLFPIILILSVIFCSCDTDTGTRNTEKASAYLVADANVLNVISKKLQSMTAEELAAESDLPIIIINTENQARVRNKIDYVTATFQMTNADANNIAESAIGIRLRGNFTYFAPKKPYRLKFDDKTSLFGRAKNKSWVLLADYFDLSHIKNYTAFTLAAKLSSMTFAPLAVHVNLILNGKFQGLYLLSDQINENKGRTNVKVDELPEVDIPFLVEIDFYASRESTEGVEYFKIGNRNFSIKYPEYNDDPEKNDLTTDRFNYVRNYITVMDTAIRAHDGYEDLLDINAFTDFYLVQELMGQNDINHNSIWMSRAADGKLKMGPVWDFDWSAGGFTFNFKDEDYVCNATIWRSTDNWFAALLDDPDFVDDLYARWNGLSDTIDTHIDEIEAYRDTIRADVLRDQKLWKLYPRTTNPLLTFDGQYQYVLDFLAGRKEWMTTTIAGIYDVYY